MGALMKFLVLIIFSIINLKTVEANKLPLPTTKMNISFQQVGLKDAVNSLLYDSGHRYKIDSSIDNTQKIDLEVTELEWSKAFEKLIKAGKLKYSFTKDSVLVVKKK